jgi:hypothetical protein
MKRYVHNHSALAIFVGGLLIQPGEGREVDASLLPPEFADPPAAEQAPAPSADVALRELLQSPLKELLPLLDEQSPATLADLARLEGEDATPRKTLLGAIAELQLQRAQAATGGAPA